MRSRDKVQDNTLAHVVIRAHMSDLLCPNTNFPQLCIMLVTIINVRYVRTPYSCHLPRSSCRLLVYMLEDQGTGSNVTPTPLSNLLIVKHMEDVPQLIVDREQLGVTR